MAKWLEFQITYLEFCSNTSEVIKFHRYEEVGCGLFFLEVFETRCHLCLGWMKYEPSRIRDSLESLSYILAENICDSGKCSFSLKIFYLMPVRFLGYFI